MKKETKIKLFLLLHSSTAWHSVINYSFITIFIILIVILPILNNQIGTPPYWAIWMIFGGVILLYSMYWIILLLCKNDTTDSKTSTDNDTDNITDNGEEEARLQQQSNSSSLIEQDDDNTTIETSYNPSTVGIPPSSFLAPTINQQASIRSSSLDYTPPPPAYYHDMIYPPSYRSTNSTKDDNVSTL